MVNQIDGHINCSFFRVATSDLAQVDVPIGVGMSAQRQRLRERVQAHAAGGGWDLYAMPGLIPDSEDWLVYKRGTQMSHPEYLKRLPSREAAEMWMVHNGL